MIPLLFLFLAQSADQPCKIEGTVVSSTNGEPLRKVTVAVGDRDRLFSAVTARDGKFAFELSPGAFRLTLSRPGYLDARAKAITLSPGEQKTGITLKLTPQAIVSGQVIDEDGDLVAGANVVLLRAAGPDGKRLAQIDSTDVNGEGVFTITDLKPGDYLLRADPAEVRPHPFARTTPPFVPTWFPAAIDSASATRIHIAPGAAVRDLEIRMRTARTFHVHGKIDVPAGAAGMPGNLSLVSPDESLEFSAYINQGEFEFPSVPPGSYTLRSFGVTHTDDRKAGTSAQIPARYFVRQPVAVADRDVDDLAAQLLTAVDIAGVIHTGDLKIEKWPVIHLEPEFFLSFREIIAEPDERGAFKLTGLPPDRFVIEIDQLPDGVYVKSMRHGNDEIAGRVDLASGNDAPLEFTFAPHAAEIRGTLRDESGDPVPANVIYLWSSGSTPARMIQSASDGSFRFTNLAPGEYHLAAWDDADQAVQADYRNAFASQTITVKVSEDSHESVEVKLIAAN